MHWHALPRGLLAYCQSWEVSGFLMVCRYMGKLNGRDSSTHATSSSTSNPEDWDTRVAAEPLRCLYSYYTAGSGGAGPTILETSFLLAGEGVEAYLDGKKVSPVALCLMLLECIA